MTGKEEYELKKINKINNLLEKNPQYLTSYHNFIGTNKSFDTKYNYCLTVIDFMNKTNKGLDELCMDDFTVYLDKIVRTKSSSYGIRAHAALKLFAKYLYRTQRISYNPMEDVERPKYKETFETQRKRDIGFLSKKEIQQVKYNIQHGVGNEYSRGRQEPFRNRDMLIFLIFLSTGMRCSALTKLDLSDIDIDKKTVSVYDKGDKIYLCKLTDETMKYLDLWLKDREIRLNDNAKTTTALFITRNKTRISQQSVEKIVKKFCENIDGKYITPHKLRATFGTQIYEATGDIYFTQQAMHHNSPKTTELYIRGQKEANIDKTVDIMKKIIG